MAKVAEAMSLGYFMNTRWGGLAAAVAAQQQVATNEELQHALTGNHHPASSSAASLAYSEENSNPFAFTLPYAAGGPLSLTGAGYPPPPPHSNGGGSQQPTYHHSHHHHQQQQQPQSHHQQHHHHSSYAPSVDIGAALVAAAAAGGSHHLVDPLSRLTSPSMPPHLCGLDERTFGLAKSLYAPPPPSLGGLLNAGQLVDDSSSMIWQPQQTQQQQQAPSQAPQQLSVAVPSQHHSLPPPSTTSSSSSSSVNNTQQHLGNNNLVNGHHHHHHHPGLSLNQQQQPVNGLLPVLTPSSQQHVSSSEMPSDSPPSQQHQSSSSSTSAKSNGAGNGVVTKPKAKPRQPEEVVKYFNNVLTPYECQEILNYPHVYFIGAMAKKRPIMSTHNSGYDDEQDSYIHVVHDHVAYRYEVLKVIGKGSFGQVVKAYDHKNHVYVALKMVRNQPRFHRQAQEEIKILEHLKKQDKDNKMNVIHLHDCFVFRNHVCITFELLSINLYELIKKNKFQGFSLQLVRKFAHSLLQCLEALSRNRIIHCDMKPENVLLKQQGRSGIKVSTCFLCLKV